MADKKYIIQNFTTAREIKEIRKKLGLTQKEFAVLIK